MSERIQLIRFPIALLFIYFLGKLIGGFAGLPYEAGAQIFGMVPLTAALCLVWGGLARTVYGKSIGGAIALGLLIAISAQILIFGGTVLSYLVGIQTHFNHPIALVREMRDVSLGEALGTRAAGVVVNCVIGSICAGIGYGMGSLIKRPEQN